MRCSSKKKVLDDGDVVDSRSHVERPKVTVILGPSLVILSVAKDLEFRSEAN